MRLDNIKSVDIIVKSNGKTINDIYNYKLNTNNLSPISLSKLSLTKENSNLKIDNEIELSLLYNCTNEYKIYKGFINYIDIITDGIVYNLKEGNRKFYNSSFGESYRNEKAKYILQDILDFSKISKTEIECPDVEIERILFNNICPIFAIEQLIKTIYCYSREKVLKFFFDKDNVFRFGSIDDKAVNKNDLFDIKTGNITKRYLSNTILTLPLPVRHSQKVKVEDKEVNVLATAMNISPTNSYLEFIYAS